MIVLQRPGSGAVKGSAAAAAKPIKIPDASAAVAGSAGENVRTARQGKKERKRKAARPSLDAAAKKMRRDARATQASPTGVEQSLA